MYSNTSRAVEHLIEPPDAAAVAVHDGDDVGRTVDRVERDDGVVAEPKLVHVVSVQVEVVLEAVVVGVTDSLRAPFLVLQIFENTFIGNPRILFKIFLSS
jgi:hypothetical protein